MKPADPRGFLVGSVCYVPVAVLSRAVRLEGSDASCRDILSAYERLSKERAAWPHCLDKKGCRIHSSEHRRRLWSRQQGLLYPVPAYRTGLMQGAGDSP